MTVREWYRIWRNEGSYTSRGVSLYAIREYLETGLGSSFQMDGKWIFLGSIDQAATLRGWDAGHVQFTSYPFWRNRQNDKSPSRNLTMEILKGLLD